MKPQVAIIYSHTSNLSNESKNLAFYLTALLLSTGYCGVHLIGLPPDGSPCDYSSRTRILYAKYPNSKPVEVPVSPNRPISMAIAHDLRWT
jgi:hypothetical protein